MNKKNKEIYCCCYRCKKLKNIKKKQTKNIQKKKMINGKKKNY